MEIGSFIGLDLKNSGEYYSGDRNIARLNSARAGIYHACRLYNCKSIHIPYYLCPTVKNFLESKNIHVSFYFISDEFEPLNLRQDDDHAILLVNYFGILSNSKIKMLAKQFENVIIDNSSAFFSNPVDGCYNVYSPRKFLGVPDGCYVIGKDANQSTELYNYDYSSLTASFLLKRLEFSLEETYKERMKNEQRIDESDVLKMSKVTRALLNNIDYSSIKLKRGKNILKAHDLFKKLNLLDPLKFIDNSCIPMVYPLVIEKIDLTDKLVKNKIFVGRLWNIVLKDVPENSFEAWLSRYLVPIPIDQRYGIRELTYIYRKIVDL